MELNTLDDDLAIARTSIPRSFFLLRACYILRRRRKHAHVRTMPRGRDWTRACMAGPRGQRALPSRAAPGVGEEHRNRDDERRRGRGGARGGRRGGGEAEERAPAAALEHRPPRCCCVPGRASNCCFKLQPCQRVRAMINRSRQSIGLNCVVPCILVMSFVLFVITARHASKN